MSFRTKLLLSYAGLVAGILLVVGVLMTTAVSRELREELDERLAAQALAAAGWLEAGDAPREVADRIAKASQGRGTIIDRHGTVIADSDVPAAKLASVENHASRPEVLDARARGVGRATRHSVTTDRDFRYVAVATGDGHVVRVAAPLTQIQSHISATRQRLIVSAVIALITAIVLGFVVARAVVRPLRRMTEAAARVARGDEAIDLPTDSADEFGALARSLSSLSAQVNDRITQLSSERDRLGSLLAGMIEGVVVVNRDGRVHVANPAAARILGATPPLVGRTVAETIRHPGARAAVEKAMRDGSVGELSFETTAADPRAVELNVRPLDPAAGGGAVAVLHDVTHLRRLETMRRDFVSNVSHEFRTPVASIQGYSEALLDGAVDDAANARRFVEVIHRNATRLGRLVTDLLRLSQLEARAAEPPTLEAVNVAAVATHVADTVGDRAAAVSARIVVVVPETLEAHADPDGVEQILLNLVDNALKYGKAPGGTITIRGERTPAGVAISVEDDGPGIESRHLPRLFERFYRVDDARTGGEGGTGLGLAIVKGLATRMKGTVEVTSQLGKGSRFTLRLPGAMAEKT